jgi:hypothetical protein
MGTRLVYHTRINQNIKWTQIGLNECLKWWLRQICMIDSAKELWQQFNKCYRVEKKSANNMMKIKKSKRIVNNYHMIKLITWYIKISISNIKLSSINAPNIMCKIITNNVILKSRPLQYIEILVWKTCLWHFIWLKDMNINNNMKYRENYFKWEKLGK